MGTASLLLLTALGASARAGDTVALSNVYTALPATTDDLHEQAITFANAPGGRAGLLTLELEDDFDAIQVGAINQRTQAWGLAGVVAAPSASYGGDSVIGAAAYDLDGRPLTEMLPVQWSNNGVNSAPSTANPPLSLATSAPVAGGQSSLPFTSTTAAPAYGSAQPAAGWFVTDGLGCIAPGTTVRTVSANAIGLSAPVTSLGCGAGQAIYFSAVAFGPFAQAVGAGSAAGVAHLTFSDWLPLRSLPRGDGGFSPGGTMSGKGIQSGTTLAAVGYTSITLSRPLVMSMPAQSPVAITYTQSLAADAPTAASTLMLGDTTGIRPGQTVSGASAVPAHTHVASVSGTTVTLDQPTTDSLSAGASLSFTNTIWTSLPSPVGSTVLPVPSTSGRPLLHLRYFTQPGQAITDHAPTCWRNPSNDDVPCESPLGLPPVWASAGGEAAGQLPIDGVNFVSQIGAGAGGAHGRGNYPSFFVRFLGRHGGATLLICGGYQSSGAAGSVSDEAPAARIGAAWASAANPSVPIQVVNVASYHLSTNTDFANCTALIDAVQPNLVIIQDFSNHNGTTSPAAYRAKVQAVARHALAAGAQPIIYLAYVEATAQIGGVPVAADVNNSAHVPLLTGIARQGSGSPTLITGPGIPADTTARLDAGQWDMTLSRPVTIKAGTLLHFGFDVAASDGTSVTLNHPSFLTVKNDFVTASGIPPAATFSVAKQDTSGSLSTAVTLQPGTLLQMTHAPGNSDINYASAGQWFYGATDNWDENQLDALGILGTDPAHPTFMCDGCTTDGEYANDYGNSLIATRFVTLLQQLTGQTAQPAATRPAGN